MDVNKYKVGELLTLSRDIENIDEPGKVLAKAQETVEVIELDHDNEMIIVKAEHAEFPIWDETEIES